MIEPFESSQVRSGVISYGVSSYGYDMRVAPEFRIFTNVLNSIVDPKSFPYLDGTELDFAKEGLNEGFRFNNPNVRDACGCGESFNV